ncbi:MAG: GNAT family N-acetyltransferase [Arcobacteraceae bacterium]
MIILETSNLYLKTIEKDDSDILYEKIFSNEETMKYAFLQKTLTIEETKKFIYKNFCKNNANIGLAPIFEKTSGQLVGVAGVLKCDELGNNHYEFGFAIAQEFRNKGYAAEIAQAQMIFIKKRLKQNRAFALVHKDNIASKNLLLKLGMSFEKEINLEDRGQREVYIKKV